MGTKKHIKVNLGTDIKVVVPSHPLEVAFQTKRIIERILTLEDKEFEFSCNSPEAIEIFQLYGSKRNPKEIKVEFFINGNKSSYEEALQDLARGRKFIEEITEKRNDSTRNI